VVEDVEDSPVVASGEETETAAPVEDAPAPEPAKEEETPKVESSGDAEVTENGNGEAEVVEPAVEEAGKWFFLCNFTFDLQLILFLLHHYFPFQTNQWSEKLAMRTLQRCLKSAPRQMTLRLSNQLKKQPLKFAHRSITNNKKTTKPTTTAKQEKKETAKHIQTGNSFKEKKTKKHLQTHQ
jgi:hypothetical protein